MARNKYGIQKIVQNDLQQCINSFRRMRNGGIGIADECVEQTCKMALKHIDKLEAKLENSVEVVRCKDCYYYDQHEDYCDMFGFDPPSDEFYCRDGKRMDGEPDANGNDNKTPKT